MTFLKQISLETHTPRLLRWRSFCNLVIALWFASLLAFAASTYPSGTAIEGKIENGHYYVYGKVKVNGSTQMKYTEVQPVVYYSSLGVTLLSFVMVPAYFVAFFVKRRIDARLAELKAD